MHGAGEQPVLEGCDSQGGLAVHADGSTLLLTWPPPTSTMSASGTLGSSKGRRSSSCPCRNRWSNLQTAPCEDTDRFKCLQMVPSRWNTVLSGNSVLIMGFTQAKPCCSPKSRGASSSRDEEKKMDAQRWPQTAMEVAAGCKGAVKRWKLREAGQGNRM